MKDAMALVDDCQARRPTAIPSSKVAALRRALFDYLRDRGVVVSASVFYEGASEVQDAEAVVATSGWNLYRIVWGLLGSGHTKKQVAEVVWSVIGNLAPRIREVYDLPMRREDVTGWVWRIYLSQSGRI